MATKPRNSSLTDLQWDLAVDERQARRFIKIVDEYDRGLIDYNKEIAVEALDKAYAEYLRLDAKKERITGEAVEKIFAKVATNHVLAVLDGRI